MPYKPIIMKLAWLGLAVCLVGCSAENHYKTYFNGSMEKPDAKHRPQGWSWLNTTISFGALDSVYNTDGRYAIKLNSVSQKNGFITAIYNIPQTFKGTEIELRGFLKTDKVADGKTGIWLGLADKSGAHLPAFDNMEKHGLQGNTGWTEYRVKMPYDAGKASLIVIGANLSGNGTLWMDDFKLYIDGKLITQPLH